MSDFLQHCINGNDAEVLLALKSGVDVNTSNDDGETGLHTASACDCETTVQLLLKTDGINVNAKNNFGATPLHYAVNNDSLKTVEILAEAPGIEISAADHKGMTALHGAVVFFPKATPILIENGIDINLELNSGKSALLLACETGNLSDVETLVNLGCTLPKEWAAYTYVIEALVSIASQREASYLALKDVNWLPSVQKQEILDFLFLQNNQ